MLVMSGVAPLLNEYKYSLLITRLAQSITGGIRIERNLHWYTHLIQWSLWLTPLLLSLPFLGVSFVWNTYYLGLIYGIILSLFFLSLNIIVKLVSIKYNTEERSNNTDIPAIYQVLTYIFAHERKFSILLFHSLISGIAGYAAFLLTDVPFLLTQIPVGAIVVVYPIVWLVSTLSLYSLLVRCPDVEMTGYRALSHQDKAQLRFIRRSLYMILFGILYVVLRYVKYM